MRNLSFSSPEPSSASPLSSVRDECVVEKGKPKWTAPGLSHLKGLLGALAGLVVSFPAVVSAEPSELSPSVGHNYGDHETPRMAAVGGATRASSNSLTSLYSNPANMAAAQLYHIGAFAQIYPEANRQSYGAAVVDSLISSSGLAGGLGGVLTIQDPDGMAREWMDVRFGLSMPLGDLFFLGLTGKYITVQQNGLGPLRHSEVSGGLQDQNILQSVTFDAGATLRPSPQFAVSLTGQNLTNPDTAILPISGGLGAAFSTADFILSADAVIESKTHAATKFRAMAGGELLIADRIAARLGYRFDQGFEGHAVSGGIGYIDQKFSLDASVRRGISGAEYWAAVFGFTIHIEAMGLGSSSPGAY